MSTGARPAAQGAGLQVTPRLARWVWFASAAITAACATQPHARLGAPGGIAQFQTPAGIEFRTCTACPGPTAKHPLATVREAVETPPPAIDADAPPAAAIAPVPDAARFARADAEVPPAPADTDLTIWFDSGRTALDEASASHIDRVIEQLGGPVLEIRIAAYTDCTGSKALNNRIARERADAVRAHLEALSLPGARINVRSRGKCCYAASNASESGRAANRRAVLTFIHQPHSQETSNERNV